MKKRNWKLFLTFVMFGFLLNSCNSDNSKSYPYAVRLTDAPGPYQEVNVDIQGVEITGEGGENITLDINPGIYNLLDFSNGNDTLIASGTLEISKVEQIRLILGPNNTVVDSDGEHQLSTPSAEQSGLKLQVHQSLQEGILYSVLLDFDANKSIVKLGNGGFKLKPVIRTIEEAISGSIKGEITPIGTIAAVEATNIETTISYSSNVNEEGKFQILGLPAGTYSVTITPELPLLPITIDNVVVEVEKVTDTGTTEF
jgi:hypothetical protein